MSGRAKALIDLGALRNNCDVVRRLVGNDCQILAMIKADAYGHGLLKVADALSEVDALGVANLDEALLLRQRNIKTPVIVMSGFLSQEELSLFPENNLAAVVHHDAQLALLEKVSLQTPLAVWLKIDTGMHRLGFSPDNVNTVVKRLKRCASVQADFGLMTHLADADNVDRQFTQAQLSEFFEVTQSLSQLKSIANSAGILAYRESFQDMVRPGIMLYGVSPFSDRVGLDDHLQPVMHLTSQVIATKDLKQGDKVGYGCTWESPEDMRIAVVGIGYGDGYPRHAKNGTPVLINGVRCPLVGRVSMDMITVDLRHQPDVSVGDEVVLWGRGLPVETIAAAADTIAYELLCQLTRRIAFVYV